MVGALARSKDVRMARREVEIGASVLNGESATLGDYSRAEAGVVAVYERDAVSFFVCYGEVYGVAVVVGWAAVVEELGCFVGVE